jgi:hypothetical protein
MKDSSKEICWHYVTEGRTDVVSTHLLSKEMKYYTRTTYDITYKYLFAFELSVLDMEWERASIILYLTWCPNFCVCEWNG